MNSELMAMTTMMIAMVTIVIAMSLNLKAKASHVCLHQGKPKLAQKGVQLRQLCQVGLCLGVESAGKRPANGTMAMRGAPSGPHGIFVGMQVGVTNLSKAMGFARLTVAESDVGMQVGVERVPKGQLLIARLTSGASDVSTQVGVTT
jgi:hypothetical protein